MNTNIKSLEICVDLWAAGSSVVLHTDGISSQTAVQESTCFRSRKGHILDLLIKPQRLPCFKSKLYLGYEKE